jgi:hypothetical protein
MAKKQKKKKAVKKSLSFGEKLGLATFLFTVIKEISDIIVDILLK